jgi:hypothetical protein
MGGAGQHGKNGSSSRPGMKAPTPLPADDDEDDDDW